MSRHSLLFYDAAPSYLERRAAHREEHLERAWAAHRRGELVLGGALAEPVDGAVLLFRADGPQLVEEFARNDLYVVNGLVTRWRVREWTTVVGETSATPIHPGRPASSDAELR